LDNHIDTEVYFKIREIQGFRNEVVHGKIFFDGNDLKYYVDTIDNLISKVTKNQNPTKK